ncbi:tetratricopeptide repeat protein [Aquiflexum lacus]|uniref:tetratricopeptide repeat protein n=1 Tax=Aquiflexum lacus TaxID=2483805 RepID=UPI001894E6B4|nr:tetratricopeptide repeat protein [Aquiflexum lacus]
MKCFKIRVLPFILIFILLNGFGLFAQDLSKVDSLQYLIETSKNDSIKVYLNVAISREYAKKEVLVSLEYGEKALEIAEKSKNPKYISYALFNLGVQFFQQGVMELAIPYFYRYLEIHKELNDDKAIAYAMTNIGAIYLQIKELDNASEYFENSLEIFEKIYADSEKPGKEIISIYNNLGVIAKQRNQSNIAIDFYKKGISLARRTPGFETELSNLLNNLGTIYMELEEFDKSFVYLSEAFELRESKDDRSGLIKSFLSIGKFHRSQQKGEDALASFYNALELAQKVGVISSISESQYLIFEIYHEKAMLDSALKYHLLHTALKDKINNENALKELQQFEITSNFREKENLFQIELDRKESNIKLLSLISGLIIIILGLLYFLANNRSRRLRLEKENIILNSKNIALQKTKVENELTVKTKELATGVIYQIQKNELIKKVIEKLKKLSISERKNQTVLIKEIIVELNNAQNPSVWEEFEIRFQQVNDEFYDKINEINPPLSTNDRRLCAFLKLNLTTKEISSITGQSYRSIEVARTRLRKKLNLTNTETSLVEYFSKI